MRFATPPFYFGDRSIVGEVPSSNIADATSRRPPPIGRARAASFAAAPKFRSGRLGRLASRGAPTLANRPTQRAGARGTRPELGAAQFDAPAEEMRVPVSSCALSIIDFENKESKDAINANRRGAYQ